MTHFFMDGREVAAGAETIGIYFFSSIFFLAMYLCYYLEWVFFGRISKWYEWWRWRTFWWRRRAAGNIDLHHWSHFKLYVLLFWVWHQNLKKTCWEMFDDLSSTICTVFYIQVLESFARDIKYNLYKLAIFFQNVLVKRKVSCSLLLLLTHAYIIVKMVRHTRKHLR